MQKAIVVTGGDITDPNFRELTQLLESGKWKYVASCPMPSSVCNTGGNSVHTSKVLPTCLVIIEEVKNGK